MEDTLISFETAKLAKEKGFNIPTKDFYGLPDKTLYLLKQKKEYKEENHNDNDLMGKNRTSAPTQSLLQKWLREEKKTDMAILTFQDEGKEPVYDYAVYWNKLTNPDKEPIDYQDGFFDKYEFALETALRRALETI